MQLEQVVESCPNLKYIVVMEDIDGNRYKLGDKEVVDFRYVHSLVRLFRNHASPALALRYQTSYQKCHIGKSCSCPTHNPF
jgi:hypothetical protein